MASQLTNPTPPPSPIPTGKGSRSASNEPFSRFLHNSLRVPDLALPPSHSPNPTHRRPIPAEVDLRSLVSSVGDDCADRIPSSAKELGVFRISGHGISVDELRSLLIEEDEEEEEGEWNSGDSEKESREVLRGLFGRNGNPKEEISWVSSSPNEPRESLLKRIGNERYRELSVNLKNVASKLEAIAEKLGRILFENAGNLLTNQRRVCDQGKEYVLSLYRHNHKSSLDQSQLTLNIEKENNLCDHSLSLHLPFDPCQIYVQSTGDDFYFDAGPETLVVTIGKQHEKWSLRESKCVSGKMTFVPADIRESPDYSFSLELKFSSSNSNNVLNRNCNTISIGDQIVVAIIITLLYQIFVFLTSQIARA